MATRPRTIDVTADEALARLIEGNERFLREAPRAAIRRASLTDLAKAQRPYATILGCSDSRVPPEWVFDAGLGELFVVRVAGNVLSPEVAGSLQYAGSHLMTPLFVVLGHEGCGAIAAALATKYDKARFKSRIQILVDSIVPGVAEFQREDFAGQAAVPGGGEQCPPHGAVGRRLARGTSPPRGGTHEDRRRGVRDRIGARALAGPRAAFTGTSMNYWSPLGVLNVLAIGKRLGLLLVAVAVYSVIAEILVRI